MTGSLMHLCVVLDAWSYPSDTASASASHPVRLSYAQIIEVLVDVSRSRFRISLPAIDIGCTTPAVYTDKIVVLEIMIWDTAPGVRDIIR